MFMQINISKAKINSSPLEVLCEKTALKNWTKFTVKNTCSVGLQL